MKKKLKGKEYVAVFGTTVKVHFFKSSSGYKKYRCIFFLDGTTRWFDPEDILASEEYCCYWYKYYIKHKTFVEKRM